jgi:hypothetical protein
VGSDAHQNDAALEEILLADLAVNLLQEIQSADATKLSV